MRESPSTLPLFPFQKPATPPGASRLAPPPLPTAPAWSIGDIYFVLFRQKRRIALCALLGVVAALAVRQFHTPVYQSEAKLFIRYVTENRSAGPSGEHTRIKSLESQGEAIINSEIEIMTSLDLLIQVVDNVGPARIAQPLATGNIRNRALGAVASNLHVDVPPQSRVVHLVFKHPDPDVVQPVLRELIDVYLRKHVEIHRALGITGDFLARETQELRSRLAETEEQLRTAQRSLGAASVEDARRFATEQIARLEHDLQAAQAEQAEHAAILQQFVTMPVTSSPDAGRALPTDLVDSYRHLDGRVAQLHQKLQELGLVFTGENIRIKALESELARAQAAKRAMEEANPGLLTYQAPRTGTSAAGNFLSIDLVSETARARAVDSKLKVYREQLEQVRAKLAEIERVEATVQELRRQRDLEETNYRYYSASLEQSRIDEALGAGHVSNISEVQSPSRPVVTRTKVRVVLGGIVMGGLAMGLAWAFAIEQLFDRTIKRPSEVERLLKLPLFLSIPDIGRRPPPRLGFALAKRLLPGRNGSSPDPRGIVRSDGERVPPVPPWDPAHVLYPFHETLRDRLVAYFESIGLTHKPKLVAVTGVARSSGVTTIAAGLAQRLSETGEGNVLLVDMTAGHGSAQQFMQGEPVCGIDEVLDTRAHAHVQENLYVVAEATHHERLSRNLPLRFSKLVPKLKASDFDYIILDMPPVSQISITPRLAGLMDMVLLVVESEKTDRNVVQRATMLLAESKVRLAAILNRVHTYVPPRLYQESLSDV